VNRHILQQLQSNPFSSGNSLIHHTNKAHTSLPPKGNFINIHGFRKRAYMRPSASQTAYRAVFPASRDTTVPAALHGHIRGTQTKPVRTKPRTKSRACPHARARVASAFPSASGTPARKPSLFSKSNSARCVYSRLHVFILNVCLSS